MKYTIKTTGTPEEIVFDDGGTLLKTAIVMDNDEGGYIFTKAPVSRGDILEGSFAPDAKGGMKFTKDKKPFGGQSSMGFGGGRSSSPREFKADPEKQASIEMQSSLAQAVTATFNFYTLMGEKPSSRDDYMKHIAETAVGFRKVVSVRPEPKIEEPSPPTRGSDEEINLDDIPF